MLQTRDLDDLLSAVIHLGPVGAEDVARIRSVLREWREPQAVANLLFNPRLIPEEVRTRALLRGLSDRDNPYNALAATVGLQGVDPAGLPGDERAEVRSLLIGLIEGDRGVLAARASLSVWRYLQEADIPRVLGLVAHPQDTTRHNLLAWLYETIAPRDSQEFIETIAARGASAEALESVRRALQEHDVRVAAGQPATLTLRLMAYIPNLADMQRPSQPRR